VLFRTTARPVTGYPQAMFSTGGTISTSTIGVLAQILPTLLGIGLLVPILSKMRVQTPERLYFASQTLVVLFTEGNLLWFLIQGRAAPGYYREVFWGACIYAMIGILVVAFAWARPSREERVAERAEAQAHKLARAERRALKNARKHPLPPSH